MRLPVPQSGVPAPWPPAPVLPRWPCQHACLPGAATPLHICGAVQQRSQTTGSSREAAPVSETQHMPTACCRLGRKPRGEPRGNEVHCCAFVQAAACALSIVSDERCNASITTSKQPNKLTTQHNTPAPSTLPVSTPASSTPEPTAAMHVANACSSGTGPGSRENQGCSSGWYLLVQQQVCSTGFRGFVLIQILGLNNKSVTHGGRAVSQHELAQVLL